MQYLYTLVLLASTPEILVGKNKRRGPQELMDRPTQLMAILLTSIIGLESASAEGPMSIRRR
jgi:hypothetical protein